MTALPDVIESGSAGFASSLDPASPSTYHRPPSPRIVTPRQRAKPRALFQDQDPDPPLAARSLELRTVLSMIKRMLKLPPTICSVRVIPTILLWSCALYAIHTFLLPIPGAASIIKAARPKGKASTNSISHQHLSNFFPPPPVREGDDALNSASPLYRPFRPVPPPDPPFPRLRPTRFLPDRCLEQWFADGETICGKGEMGEEETLDVTWLWVNGSDPRWIGSMTEWSGRENVFSPIHHFRCVLVPRNTRLISQGTKRARAFHAIGAGLPTRITADLSSHYCGRGLCASPRPPSLDSAAD